MGAPTFDKEQGRVLFRQLTAISGLSAKRLLSTFHVWSFFVLSALPLVIALFIGFIHLINSFQSGPISSSMLAGVTRIVNGLYTGGYLHFSVIFSSAIFGASVLREEYQNQTIHYYYLSTMPRWMLVVGKMFGFYMVVFPMYIFSWFSIKAVMYFPLGVDVLTEKLLSLAGLKVFIQELAVLALAFFVYSSIFITWHNFFKNSIFILFIYGWELASNLMPKDVQVFTVIYYLKGLIPFKFTDKAPLIGIPSESPSVFICLLVLGGVFMVCTTFSGWWATRSQCLYGSG